MRVLMIAPQPFFEVRGTPISVSQRIKALLDQGHLVDLLTYPQGQDVDLPGLTIHRVPNLFGFKSVKIGPSWKKVVLDILMVFKAISMLRQQHYDVIHSHEEAAFFAQALSGIFSVRHLADMHSVLSKQLNTYNFGVWWFPIKIFELLEQWVIKNCDVIISVGEDIEKYVYSVKPDAKIVMIDNLALEEVLPNDHQAVSSEFRLRNNLNGKKVVVYTGNFQPYQGLDLLLSSAALVRQAYPDVQFILIGAKKHELPIWNTRILSYGLLDYASVIEAIPPEELSLYHAIAEILVSPRIKGGTIPLKIYSYLHIGKPIIATDIPAHRGVLTDEVAMLVPPDHEKFAEGILKILRNPELGKALGRNARRMAEEKFNYTNYLNKLQYAYQLMSEAPSGEQEDR